MNDIIQDLEIELSNKCNFKCPLCLSQTNTVQNIIKNMPTYFLNEHLLYNTLYQYRHTLKFCTFAGSISEPTLHPNFINIIKYILKNYKNIIIALYTNGSATIETYKKISQLFSISKFQHKIIFTICGSNQRLHQIYRTDSDLNKVIAAYDVCSVYCYSELNWILFDYNADDYIENSNVFKNRNLKVFNSIPYHEVLSKEYQNGIFIPKKLSKYMMNLTHDMPIKCSADVHNFRSLAYDGNLYKCNMYRFFNDKYCFLCNTHNINMMISNQITPPPEPAGEVNVFNSKDCIL